MNKTDTVSPCSWFQFPWNTHKEESKETLGAFVRDSEHEIMAVLTALQAQIDLLHQEQLANSMPVDRFPGLNRAVARLIADTYSLSFISELAMAPRSTKKVALAALIREAISETEQDFSNAHVSVSFSIPEGTTLTGDADSLKQTCKGLLIVAMQKCPALGSIKIVVEARKKSVSISYDIGTKADEETFALRRVGDLKSVPSNGEGIKLAAIDAMARMHRGQLEVSSLPDVPDSYRLIFYD